MNNTVCDRPPPGWWCSRQAPHEGPCAARPEVENIPQVPATQLDLIEATRLLKAVDLALEEEGPWLQLQKDIRAFLRSKGR